MARFSRKAAQVPVSVVGISLDDTPISELECQGCGEPLDIHQPDGGFPDRMLGTCLRCHTWYLWDFEADHNRGVMVSLPDAGYFRDAAKAPAG